jgi:hypothetical protein
MKPYGWCRLLSLVVTIAVVVTVAWVLTELI